MLSLPTRSPRGLALGALILAACGGVSDGPDDPSTPLSVAVAANFASTLDGLRREFEARSGTTVVASVGATGAFYSQIRSGAPYHVFLAADTERGPRLEAEGLAVEGSGFVYAEGRLAVFAPRLGEGWTVPGVFRTPGLQVSWANPRTAPYGVAALAALEAWGVTGVEGAVGESVGQVAQFVRAGAADVGFVALAQVVGEPPESYREVPSDLYPAIRQGAVLLAAGRDRPDARAFLAFLRSPFAIEHIRSAGYTVDGGGLDGR